MTQLQIYYVSGEVKISGCPDPSPNDESQMWRYFNMTIERNFGTFLEGDIL